MKIRRKGGQVIYDGKCNVYYDVELLTLTENLSTSDKRRKLLTVELSQDEIMQCVDKLGYKIMPRWLVTVFEFVEKVKVKLKGLV